MTVLGQRKWGWHLGWIFLVVGCIVEPVATQAARPNILFIMADDHGYQAMSCYGSQVNRHPIWIELRVRECDLIDVT